MDYNCNDMQRLFIFLAFTALVFAQQEVSGTNSGSKSASEKKLQQELRVEKFKRIASDLQVVQDQVQAFAAQKVPPLQQERDALIAEICGEANLKADECDVDQATATAKKKAPPVKPEAAKPEPPKPEPVK